jgi:Polysaccharide lyase
MRRRLPILALAAFLALPGCVPAIAAAKPGGRHIHAHKAKISHPSQRRTGLGQARAVSPRRHHPAPAVTAKSAPGTLLFKAEHINEFWLNQSAPGAVTEVPNPTGGGESVLQMTVKNSDVYPVTPTDNPRAELISEPIFNEGSEFWASAKFFLPSSFPSSVPGWLTLLEGPFGEPFAGTPPWHLEVNGEGIRWQRNETYSWDIPWEMPLEREKWVEVMLHERYAHDGWIEMWINGQQVNFFAGSQYNPLNEPSTYRLSMETRDASTDEGPGAIHEMNYREAGMFATTTVLEGPLAIGTDRESVES